jgi:ribonuclease-3
MTSNKKEDDANFNPDEIDEQVHSRIGYSFKNRNLMLEAVTHKSWFNENSPEWFYNERLEFLGDAVLDLIISERMMNMVERWPEGDLTRFRSALVNEDNLARVADKLDIGAIILLGRGESKNKGRKRPSILSDCVEAVVGAIFLDSDFATCTEVVLTWFEEMITSVVQGNGMADYKTLLQQKLQTEQITPVYNTVSVQGPDHDRTYEVEIAAGGKVLERGRGKSKKEAEKEAAKNSLKVIDSEL